MLRDEKATECEERGSRCPSRVKDARGTGVAALDPYSLRLLRRFDVIEAEPLREITEEIGPGVSKWHRRIYWIGFAVGLYSVCSALLLRARSGAALRFAGTPDAIVLLFLIVFFGGLQLYVRGARRARLRRVCGVMLRHLRCSRYGYDIRGLPTAIEDGVTICPECGSAWKLEDPHTGRADEEETPAD